VVSCVVVSGLFVFCLFLLFDLAGVGLCSMCDCCALNKANLPTSLLNYQSILHRVVVMEAVDTAVTRETQVGTGGQTIISLRNMPTRRENLKSRDNWRVVFLPG